jgi:hypothetical protein
MPREPGGGGSPNTRVRNTLENRRDGGTGRPGRSGYVSVAGRLPERQVVGAGLWRRREA